jgi:archaellin
MEEGEQFEITVDMTALGGTFTNPLLGKHDYFNIQIKPVSGSSMTIQRTLPASIEPVIDLH